MSYPALSNQDPHFFHPHIKKTLTQTRKKVNFFTHNQSSGGGMVDTGDLKSPPGNRVRVRLPPRAFF